MKICRSWKVRCVLFIVGLQTDYKYIDTDAELNERLQNFDEHVNKQKQKRRREGDRLQDVDDELAAARKEHVALTAEQGKLEERLQVCVTLSDNDVLVHTLSRRKMICLKHESTLSES